MKNEILTSLIDKNTTQARRLVQYFQSKGFDGSSEKAYSLIITCLNIIYKKEHTDEDFKLIITDGIFDDGVDAVVFAKESLDLFDFKIEEGLGTNDLKNFRESIIRNFLKAKPKDFSICERLKKQIKQWHSSQNKRKVINLFIIRKKYPKKFGKQVDAMLQDIKNIANVNLTLLTLDEVISKLLEIDFLSEWNLSVNSATKMWPIDDRKEYSEIIVNVNVLDLLKLYQKHIDDNKDLFSSNVRIPHKNFKFQNGLLKTIQNETKKFFLFHNGITIIAKKIISESRQYKIIEPQVVNGAQTIGNLSSLYKNNPKDIHFKNAKVVCKLIQAVDQQLIDRICESSNTQKAVRVEDLRTNDLFQKELEIFIFNKSKGKYIYNRKGSLHDKKIMNIPYIKFFQWSYAAFYMQPAQAKNARKSIFENDIRGEYEKVQKLIKTNSNRIIELCDIGILVDKKIKSEKNKNKKSMLRHMDFHIIAGLYYLKSNSETDINEIFNILQKYYIEQMRKDKNLNENKIFTKSIETWNYLKNNITK